MNRYLIVADDFTGANDTGVQLRRRGLPTSVIFSGKKLPESTGCLVLDTESRSAAPEAAAERVRVACREIRFAHYNYVIKKVDSTLRGNIAAEVAALEEGFQSELVIFCPALPALGRTTEGGIHRLNGVPLTETQLAADPKNPVTEDNIARLLAPAYAETVHTLSLADIRSGNLDLSQGKVFACDAVTDEDMRQVITAARADGRRTLWIGTAAMADNIMELEHATAPVLGVAASVSQVTGEQIRTVEKSGASLVIVPFHEILAGRQGTEGYVDKAVELLTAGKDTVLVSSSTLDRAELDAAKEEGARRGMELPQVSDYVRETIGAMASAILDRVWVSGVFVTGGDTALGLLESLGADGSEILSEVSVGIPMMRLIGGRAAGMKMVTKAGAFGSKDAVSNAFRKLKEE